MQKKSNMRVAIVVPVFPPYRGGIGTVASHDAALLRARGVDVTVITPRYAQKKTEGNDVGLLRLVPMFAWGNAAILPSVLWRLRTYDLVHLHYPFYGTDLLVAIACAFFRIPLVVTYHMRPKSQGLLGAIFVGYRWVFEWIILRFARVVLVSSLEYADALSLRHARRIALPFSVDTKRFCPGDQKRAREGLGCALDVPTLLFVGGLDKAHYFKGLEVLLRACRMLRGDWQLLVVGSGSERGVFEQMVRALGIASRVSFVGSVPFEQLPEVYRAADVHVLPSIDRSEAFGIVTEEAMATGIPSIVSRLPGVSSLVLHGETGFHVAPRDADDLCRALQALCDDELLRVRMGRAARVRAESVYADDVCGDELFRLYKSCLSRQE